VRAVVLALLISCGDNIVRNDASALIDSSDLGECCRLLIPNPIGQDDKLRACVATKTAPETCRRLNCIVFDEWLCFGGITADDTRVRDGKTECMCGGRWP